MDFYEILGVARTATTAEIRKAFRKLAASTHPDVGGDVEAFRELEEAARVLSEPEERAFYDRVGKVRPEQNLDPRRIEMLAMLQSLSSVVIAEMKSSETDNFVEKLISKIRAAQKEVTDNEKLMAPARTKLEKIKKRIKSKGEENILAAMVQKQIDNIDAQVDVAAQMQQAFLDGLVFLQDYDYEVTLMLASEDLMAALRRQDSGAYDRFFTFKTGNS